jgi:hypothetical protein
MGIVGIENMTPQMLRDEVNRGGKFVSFQYCISIIILTFKRSSDIYFIPAGQSAVLRGLPFVALSLLLGWWGIPWGPIYTIWSLVVDLKGGQDVTAEVLPALLGESPIDPAQIPPINSTTPQPQRRQFSFGAWLLVGLTGIFVLMGFTEAQVLPFLFWTGALLLILPPLKPWWIEKFSFLHKRVYRILIWIGLMLTGFFNLTLATAVSALVLCDQPQQDVCPAEATLLQNQPKLYLSGQQQSLKDGTEFTVNFKPTSQPGAAPPAQTAKAKVLKDKFLLELTPKTLPAGTYELSLTSPTKVKLPPVKPFTIWAATIDRLVLCTQPQQDVCAAETPTLTRGSTSLYLSGEHRYLQDGTELSIDLNYSSEPKKSTKVALPPVKAKVKDKTLLLALEPKELAVGTYQLSFGAKTGIQVKGDKTFTVWDTEPEAKARSANGLPTTQLTVTRLAMCDRSNLPMPELKPGEEEQLETEAKIIKNDPNFCKTDRTQLPSQATAIGFRLDFTSAVEPARIKIVWKGGGEEITKPHIMKLSGRSKGLNYTLSSPDGFPKGEYELFLSLEAQNARPIYRKFTVI